MLGQTISHYRVVDKIGQGGMGEVWKAEDTRLKRTVALKFLPGPLSGDARALERFQREAQTASALSHPGICTIFDIDAAGGQPFIAMEYVEGATLQARIGAGPLRLDDLLDLGIQIADALEAAHSKSIVHRDIKPGNIMVTPSGRAKIMDFGLAKLAGECRKPGMDTAAGTLTMAEPVTNPGTALGTVAYMSPEQARGEELDARTDLYSFGATLYEMATGVRPFQGSTSAVLFDAILHRAPVSTIRVNPDLPEELDRIIRKALEKDRAVRYQSAADLRADLKRLARDTESARTAAVSDEPRPKRGRRWWRYAAAAAAVVALAGAGFWFRSRNTKPLTDRDVLLLADFTNTTGDAVFDGALRQALSMQLEQSPFLQVQSEEQIRRTLRYMGRPPEEKLIGEVAREVCERENLKAMLSGSIAPLGSGYVVGLHVVNCRTGETLAREQVEAASKEQVLRAVGKAATNIRAKLGESLSSIQKLDVPIAQATSSSLEALKALSQGYSQGSRGSPLAAIAHHQRAVELDPELAVAHAGMAISYRNLGETQKARESLRKAFSLIGRVSEWERILISSSYYGYATRETDKAVEVLELARQTYPRAYFPVNNLGVQLAEMGQDEKALELFQEAVRLRPSALGHANVALELIYLNRFDEARGAIEKTIADGMDSMSLRLHLFRLGAVQGDSDTVAKQVEWASGKPEEYRMHSQQAAYASALGMRRKARDYRARAIEAVRRRKLDGITATYHAVAASHDAVMGHCDTVREEVRAALALAREHDAITGSAFALALCGEPRQAESLIQELAAEYPNGTLVNAVWAPVVKATMAWKQKQPAKAIELLKAAIPYERANPRVAYVRGLALMEMGAAGDAAVEFQSILDRRGAHFLSNAGVYPAAYVGLARAAARAGDTARSRKAYEDFFALWKNADPGIPILAEAKKEYAALR